MNASKSLKEAADVISSSSSALQLRFEDLFFSWEDFLTLNSKIRLSIIEAKKKFQIFANFDNDRHGKKFYNCFPYPDRDAQGNVGWKNGHVKIVNYANLRSFFKIKKKKIKRYELYRIIIIDEGQSKIYSFRLFLPYFVYCFF